LCSQLFKKNTDDPDPDSIPQVLPPLMDPDAEPTKTFLLEDAYQE